VFMLENLNLPVDHPGVPFALAKDTLALVSSVNRPGLTLNLDLYHAQIGEGNLIELCRVCLPWIGEIQVADVPGRKEPGTGEINYAGVAIGLKQMGYRGPVCMEAFASGDADKAVEAFRAAFTV
jgi:hydroxypyruvate isomerase